MLIIPLFVLQATLLPLLPLCSDCYDDDRHAFPCVRCQVTPPFKPKVSGAGDVSNFEKAPGVKSLVCQIRGLRARRFRFGAVELGMRAKVEVLGPSASGRGSSDLVHRHFKIEFAKGFGTGM